MIAAFLEETQGACLLLFSFQCVRTQQTNKQKKQEVTSSDTESIGMLNLHFPTSRRVSDKFLWAINDPISRIFFVITAHKD